MPTTGGSPTPPFFGGTPTDRPGAQDNDANVRHIGENVSDRHDDDADNLLGIRHSRAWKNGANGARPGYIMEVNPQIDDHYLLAVLCRLAEDQDKVFGLGESLTIPFGTFNNIRHSQSPGHWRRSNHCGWTARGPFATGPVM